jgi:glycosyltransferase involved in cell wall biosynthesis
MKNEEATLEQCLASAAPWVDKIVIVDTGSTDNSVAIARKFGAEVYYYEWNDDFATARNFGLERADGDWCIFLDADEELLVTSGQSLRCLLENPDVEVYLLSILNLTGEGNYVSHLGLRLFRKRAEYRFIGALHEQIYHPAIYQPGKCMPVINGVMIRHYGYLPEMVSKRNKSERNMRIAYRLAVENPENAFYQYNLGMEYFRRKQYTQAIDPLLAGYRFGIPRTQSTANSLNHALQALRLAGRWKEWQASWEQGIQQYPDYVDLWYEKALFELAFSHLDACKTALEICLSYGESPVSYVSDYGMGGWKAWGLLGELYLLRGDDFGALNAFQAAVRINPLCIYKKYYAQLALQLFGPKRTLKILSGMIGMGALDPMELARIVAELVREGADKSVLQLNEEQNTWDDEEQQFIHGLALVQSGDLLGGKARLSAGFQNEQFRTEADAIMKLLEIL